MPPCAPPHAQDSVHLSLTTFDSTITEILPPTPLPNVRLPIIVCPDSGATLIGEALEHIAAAVARDRKPDDQRPILILLTDDKPTDLLTYSEILPVIKNLNFGNIVACAAGPKADVAYLKQLTDHVVSLDTMDSAGFAQFFQWAGETVVQNTPHPERPQNHDLPPPPPEINIVL